MTVRAADKIIRGLQDAVDGGISRATFYGMRWDATSWSAQCPRCSTAHRWTRRRPKWCRNCGLEFRYTANEAMLALGERVDDNG
jgi:hypothetical protein